ncbi:MAG: hypothetical protein ACLUVC_07845 [Longibaculum sp.]
MKRKFMMLFAFLLMTGFGLCLIDANNERNVKEENQTGIIDVVTDENYKEDDNPVVVKEAPIKVDDQKTNKNDVVTKITTSTKKVSDTTVKNTSTNKTNNTTNTTNKQNQIVTKTDTNNQTSNTKKEESVTKKDIPTVKVEDKTPAKEEIKKEVTPPKETKPVTYDYDIGNCGKLYDSEAKAYAAAEAKFNDFSDPDKYVSNYMVYSTYDKWSINYYYEHY